MRIISRTESPSSTTKILWRCTAILASRGELLERVSDWGIEPDSTRLVYAKLYNEGCRVNTRYEAHRRPRSGPVHGFLWNVAESAHQAARIMTSMTPRLVVAQRLHGIGSRRAPRRHQAGQNSGDDKEYRHASEDQRVAGALRDPLCCQLVHGDARHQANR